MNPKLVNGYNIFWNAVFYHPNEKISMKALDFLMHLYTNIDSELKKQKISFKLPLLNDLVDFFQKEATNEPVNQNCLMRGIKFINVVITDSEKEGGYGGTNLMNLIQGSPINLTIVDGYQREVKEENQQSAKLQEQFYSNNSLIEIVLYSAKRLVLPWDTIQLKINGEEIKRNELGKILSDKKVSNGDTVTILKTTPIEVVKVPIIINDVFSDEALEMFNKIFQEFSLQGIMKPKQVAQMFRKIKQKEISEDNKLIKEVFNFDYKKQGFITFEEFANFFLDQAKDRQSLIYDYVSNLGYRKNLKHQTIIPKLSDLCKDNPIFCLSKDENFFQILFELLNIKGEIAQVTWDLVKRLPINTKIEQDILDLKGVRNNPDNWKEILDDQKPFHLLYSLHIVEHLLETEQQNPNQSGVLMSSSSLSKSVEEEKEKQAASPLNDEIQISLLKVNWKREFIELGGFDVLWNIFSQMVADQTEIFSVKNQGSNFKQIIASLLLQIFRTYIIASFSVNNPGISEISSVIQKTHLPLMEVIVRKVKNQENILPTLPVLRRLFSQDSNTAAAAAGTSQKSEENLKESINDNQNEHTELIDGLKDGLADKIIKSLKIQDLIKFLVEFSQNYLNITDNDNSNDHSIIQYAIQLFGTLICLENKMITNFFNSNILKEKNNLLLKGIFYPTNRNIRRIFNHLFFEIILRAEKQTKIDIFYYLFQNIPKEKEIEQKNCSQYFELLCALVESTIFDEDLKEGIHFEQISDTLIDLIFTTQSQEEIIHTEVDQSLTGQLNLLERILDRSPNLQNKYLNKSTKFEIPLKIFSQCLFDLSDIQEKVQEEDSMSIEKKQTDTVLCLSRDSRSSAFQILISFCQQSPEFFSFLIKNHIGLLMKKVVELKSTNSTMNVDERSKFGFAGLKNLGATCYLNSILQQMFNSPTLRYAILRADDQQKENPAVSQKGDITYDDNLLHQLRNLFGFLEKTVRRDINPIEFTLSYQDEQGPINPLEQRDAHQFFNFFLAKMEKELGHTPFRDIFKDIFGFHIRRNQQCANCGHQSSNQNDDLETFLSLEMKNFKNLSESLQAFCQREQVEGYDCQYCEKKCVLYRYASISKLPNILLVHEKRFQMDYNTWQTKKSDSQMEFPIQLSLQPYTVEGQAREEKLEKQQQQGGDMKSEGGEKEEQNQQIPIAVEDSKEQGVQVHPPEYYQYKLTGIVVHSGVARHGHYYSFIDIKRQNEELYQELYDEKGQTSWLQFNDARICELDMNIALENDCYGGKAQKPDLASLDEDMQRYWKEVGGEDIESTSAYMLVYERKMKTNINLYFPTIEEAKVELENLQIDPTKPIENYKQKMANLQEIEGEVEATEKLENQQEIAQEKQKDIIVEVDYYAFQPYVSPDILQKVQNDNKKFLLEKSVTSEDFFTFIRDVLACFDVSQDSPTVEVDSTQNEGEIQSEEDNNSFMKEILDFQHALIFELKIKNIDKKLQENIAQKMYSVLKNSQEYTISYLEKHFLNSQNKYQEIITGSDEFQRKLVSIVLSNTISAAVNNFDLDLSDAKFDTSEKIEKLNDKGKLEYKIFSLLRNLLDLIPTQLVNHWARINQYFEFWFNLASNGGNCLKFMFERQVMSIFLELFLEKQSPVQTGPEKLKLNIPITVSSQANYNSLIKTVNLLIQFAKPKSYPSLPPTVKKFKITDQTNLFDLSPNDQQLLYCHDLWTKIFSEIFLIEYYSDMLIWCVYENQYLTEVISISIMRSFYKHSDSLKQTFDVTQKILKLRDSLSEKRFEWLIGVPCLIGKTDQYSLQDEQTESFGLYNISSSLKDSIYDIKSTLLMCSESTNCESLGTFMIQGIQWSISAFKAALSFHCILSACLQNPALFDFIIRLPPPNIYSAKFTDFIRVLLNDFISDAQKDANAGFQKIEVGMSCLSMLEKLEKHEQEYMETRENHLIQASTLLPEGIEITQTMKPNMMRGFFQPYFIGRTIIHQDLKVEKKLFPNSSTSFWGTSSKDFVFKEREYEIFWTQSFPAFHLENLSLPYQQQFMSDKISISQYNLEKSNQWSCFFSPSSFYSYSRGSDFIQYKQFLQIKEQLQSFKEIKNQTVQVEEENNPNPPVETVVIEETKVETSTDQRKLIEIKRQNKAFKNYPPFDHTLYITIKNYQKYSYFYSKVNIYEDWEEYEIQYSYKQWEIVTSFYSSFPKVLTPPTQFQHDLLIEYD